MYLLGIMRRRGFVVVVALAGVAIALAACARSASERPHGGATVTTGVVGRVVAGPTCPIVASGCPTPESIAATVRITTAPADRDAPPGPVLRTITTGDDGTFAVSLPPGTYVLSASPQAGGRPGPALTVRVLSGRPRRLTLAVDTGIR